MVGMAGAFSRSPRPSGPGDRGLRHARREPAGDFEG
jgi:hypothetical protein